MVLVNAIYFFANWSTRFEPRFEATFYSNPPRKLQMMKGSFFDVTYNEGKDFKAVEIPYRGYDVSMFVVLPKKKDGLDLLIQSMNYSKFLECTNR